MAAFNNHNFYFFVIFNKANTMKIAILGTGSVGRTLAERLAKAGHEVVIGTRDVQSKLNETGNDQYNNPPFAEWQKSNDSIKLVKYEEAGAFGEIIINATKGAASEKALMQAGEQNLRGKVIVDVANPLDATKGFPPTLIPELSNTTSLGERLQQIFPEARVVKTLNTMWAGLMANPQMIGNGDHSNFICGNDEESKRVVRRLLTDMGWDDRNVVDLGDITSARGTESYLPFWLRIMNARNTGAFNIRIVG